MGKLPLYTIGHGNRNHIKFLIALVV